MSKKKQSFLARMLNITEKAGNALPHPATLFLIFALLALVFSWLAWLVDWSAIHPGTKEEINPAA